MENYELSLWNHNDSFIRLFKGHTEIDGQAYNTFLIKNIDGSETLTFSIPLYFYSKEAAGLIQNPAWFFIKNEKKIRLIRNKGEVDELVNDFIIKQYIERKDNGTIIMDVECDNYVVFELKSKGNSIVFSENYDIGLMRSMLPPKYNKTNIIWLDYSFVFHIYDPGTGTYVPIDNTYEGGDPIYPVFAGPDDGTSDGGSGTPDNPYEIWDEFDLYNMRIYPEAHFIQMQSFEISFYSNWVPVGSYYTPFKGSYNGNNFEIVGLSANTYTQNEVDYASLFGYIEPGVGGSTFENIQLIDVDITGGYYSAGIIGELTVGTNVDSILIKNCFVSGTISGQAMVGGIIGETYARSEVTTEGIIVIEDCAVDCEISGDYWFGGIVGSVGRVTIVRNCQAEGKILGHEVDNNYYSGGIAGNVLGYSIIEKCFSNNEISAGWASGGIVGEIDYSATIRNCYSFGPLYSYWGGAGGIVGEEGEPLSIIENCYSYRTITYSTSASDIGGIIGYRPFFRFHTVLTDGSFIYGLSDSAEIVKCTQNLNLSVRKSIFFPPPVDYYPSAIQGNYLYVQEPLRKINLSTLETVLSNSDLSTRGQAIIVDNNYIYTFNSAAYSGIILNRVSISTLELIDSINIGQVGYGGFYEIFDDSQYIYLHLRSGMNVKILKITKSTRSIAAELSLYTGYTDAYPAFFMDDNYIYLSPVNHTWLYKYDKNFNLLNTRKFSLTPWNPVSDNSQYLYLYARAQGQPSSAAYKLLVSDLSTSASVTNPPSYWRDKPFYLNGAIYTGDILGTSAISKHNTITFEQTESQDFMTELSGSYYNESLVSSLIPEIITGVGEPRTENDMTDPYNATNTYLGWDFETVWKIDSLINDGYPTLKINSPE